VTALPKKTKRRGKLRNILRKLVTVNMELAGEGG
jgi:hypothetical protein